MASFTKPPPWREIRVQKSIEHAPARGGSVMIDTCKGLLIFGGSDRDQNSFQDLILFPTLEEGSKIVANSWTVMETEGDVPMPRSGHAACTYGEYLFLFGGQQALENETYSDLYVLDLNTWTWKYVGEKGDEPEERNSHSLAIIRRMLSIEGERGEKKESNVEYHDYLVLYGGAHDEKGVYDSTYYALLPNSEDENQIHSDTFYITWQTLSSSNPHPIAREMHGSASLSTPTEPYKSLLISGGRGLDTVYGDVWELTASTHSNHGNTSTTSTTSTTSDVGKEEEGGGGGEEGEPLVWIRRRNLELNPPRCSHDSTVVMKNGMFTLCVIGGFSGDALADNLAYCTAPLLVDDSNRSADNSTTEQQSVEKLGSTGTGTGTGTEKEELIESIIDAEVDDDHWTEVRLASMKGGRFGLSVCTAPEWLLIATKLRPKEVSPTTGEGEGGEGGGGSSGTASAIVMYGGINMTDIYNDTLLIVPPPT